jgi:hypothetical protein
MALAAVVGLRHQSDAGAHLTAVAELPPEQLEGEARRTHFANPLQTCEGIASFACRRRHARLTRLLQCCELLLRERQSFALAQ